MTEGVIVGMPTSLAEVGARRIERTKCPPKKLCSNFKNH